MGFKRAGRARKAEKETECDLIGRWVQHDVRDSVVDFIRDAALKFDLPELQIVSWLGLCEWVEHYNAVRLQTAVGYVMPNSVLDRTRARIQPVRAERRAAARKARLRESREKVMENAELAL